MGWSVHCPGEERAESQYGVRGTQAGSLSDPFTVGEGGLAPGTTISRPVLEIFFVSYLVFVKVGQDKGPLVLKGTTWSEQPKQVGAFFMFYLIGDCCLHSLIRAH